MREADNRKWIARLFLLLYLCCVVYITLLSRGDSLKRIFRLDVFTSWRMWLGGNAANGKVHSAEHYAVCADGVLFDAGIIRQEISISCGGSPWFCGFSAD